MAIIGAMRSPAAYKRWMKGRAYSKALPGVTVRFEISRIDIKRIKNNLRLMARMVKLQAQALPRKQAIQHTQLAILSIMTQRYFMRNYRPYHPRYKEWKRLNAPFPQKYWHLYGDLVRNIKPDQLGLRTWLSGINPTAYDAGGKSWYGGKQPGKVYGQQRSGPSKQITMYGVINERIRPLFGPLEREYSISSDRNVLHTAAMLKLLALWR